MKILQIVNTDYALYNFLLPLMRAIRARGHEVVGVCQDGPLLAKVRAEGFQVLTPPLERSASPRALWRGLVALVRLIRAEKPDMVHGHMPLSGFLARVAAWYCRVPRIAYTCHGFLFNQTGPLVRRAGSLAMEFIAGQMTDIYFTVGSGEAGDARRLWISRRAVAIGNGRDPALFHPDQAARQRIRAELGVPEDQVVITIVSRLVRPKGYPELAAAMAQLPEAELWVVGERLPGDRGPDMAALLRAAGLGARLRLLGYRADIPALLAASDIFVLPSHYEGLPMSVIEAMLSGLPVVGSDIPGISELIRPAGGIIVPPGKSAPLAQALRRLAGDGALRATMGEAGRARAATNFTEAAVCTRTCDLLGL